MPNKNLTKEQNTIRNILYGIMGLTIFTNFIIFYFALIDQKYSNIISFSMLGIFGIVNYIGYKYKLINKSSTISAIIITIIIVTITLSTRSSWFIN
jgi:CBS domain containing-hemolysin-like protein